MQITSLYDALGLAIETLFIFVMTLAIWYGAQGLEQWQNRRQPTLDSRCGMILFLLALLLGLEGLTYAGLRPFACLHGVHAFGKRDFLCRRRTFGRNLPQLP